MILIRNILQTNKKTDVVLQTDCLHEDRPPMLSIYRVTKCINYKNFTKTSCNRSTFSFVIYCKLAH
ncbi:hypothetical protein Mapa_013374 [Marchantia paleacea]|nr:hypothetical protein Mapa_013374 [Marchantia paleacea]